MRTFVKTIASGLFIILFMAGIVNDALRSQTPQDSNYLPYPFCAGEGEGTLVGYSSFVLTETYVLRGNESAHKRSYRIGIHRSEGETSLLTLSNLGGQQAIKISGNMLNDNKFIFSETLNSLNGYDTPVEVSGYGEVSGGKLTLAYLLKSPEGDLICEASGFLQ